MFLVYYWDEKIQYIINETKSFLVNVIRVFRFFTLIVSTNCSRTKRKLFCLR